MPSSDRRPAAGLPPELRRALVVGLGHSGAAAARALAGAGVEVVVAECRREAEEASTLAAAGVSEVLLGVDGLAAAGLVEDVDVVVPSPGVPEHAAVLRRAIEHGLPVWSEPEVGWRLAPRRLVAITGTNGKTTVTELVTAMLTAAGMHATACGNIGHAFTTAATASAPDALLVAELSSFQLRFAHSLRPRIGVLLNLAPDHLDWHSDFAAYAAAKGRMWQAQRRQDWAVGNAEDPDAAALVRSAAPGRVAWTTASSVPEVGVGVAGQELVARLPCHEGPLLRLEELPSVAPHHVDNVAAASAAALLVGAEAAAVAGAARAFRPGRHRLEGVALGGGVAWVDDSKATNPHAAAAALRAFHSGATPTVVWIAGGKAKGVDLGLLAAELAAVRHAVFIGEAADELAQVAATRNLPVSRAASIEEAVAVAARVAVAGDTVLLAPGCASFDQFHDYAERGDRFAAAARSAAARKEGQGRTKRSTNQGVGDHRSDLEARSGPGLPREGPQARAGGVPREGPQARAGGVPREGPQARAGGRYKTATEPGGMIRKTDDGDG